MQGKQKVKLNTPTTDSSRHSPLCINNDHFNSSSAVTILKSKSKNQNTLFCPN